VSSGAQIIFINLDRRIRARIALFSNTIHDNTTYFDEHAVLTATRRSAVEANMVEQLQKCRRKTSKKPADVISANLDR
jgi:hypothetical protein